MMLAWRATCWLEPFAILTGFFPLTLVLRAYAHFAREWCIIARKFCLLRIVAMKRTLISVLLLSVLLFSLFLINLSAQTKPSGAADYNTIFKALKWRSIGAFLGRRSNCASGIVGDPKTY